METNKKIRSKIIKKHIKTSRLKRKLLKHTWLVRFGILFLGILVLLLIVQLVGSVLGNTKFGENVSFLKNFVFTPRYTVDSINQRTNLVILGKGGADHEAPDLTDTIIFTSISHSGGDLVLVSIPRDIWIPEIRAKVNSAYYWGNQKQEGGGLVLAKSVVEEIVGQPIHHGLVIDFSGFKKVIDVLGGIDVEVENSFVDNKYPIGGKENDDCNGDKEYKCRYETVEFEKGIQTMDGETALKFVRSRNAEGDEGTDIARAKRQQEVFSAIKNKALSPSTLFSVKKISNLTKIAYESIETDVLKSTSSVLIRRFLETSKKMKSLVIPEDFLENPPLLERYDFLYVFVPKQNDWINVHEWVKGLLN